MNMNNQKEYGIFYAKYVFPKNHKLHWLGHCGLFNILPSELKIKITELTDRINLEYKDDIFIPMDKRVITGCTTTPESIEKISNDVYTSMNNIMKDLINEDNCVRLVYGVGFLNKEWIEKETKSTHEIGNFPIMIKIGHTLDNYWEPGIFNTKYS